MGQFGQTDTENFYNIIWQATISGLLKINDTVSVCGSNQQRRNKGN